MAITRKGRSVLQAEILQLKRSGPVWKEIGSTLRGWAEKGIPDNPQDKTLAQLDRLKGWEVGSSRTVLEGGEPTLIAQPEPAVVSDRAVALMRRAAALAAEAADLLEEGR